MYFSNIKEGYRCDWRIYLMSGEGQSFLEIVNLVNKHGARNLKWAKGVGFYCSQNTRSGKQ